MDPTNSSERPTKAATYYSSTSCKSSQYHRLIFYSAPTKDATMTYSTRGNLQYSRVLVHLVRCYSILSKARECFRFAEVLPLYRRSHLRQCYSLLIRVTSRTGLKQGSSPTSEPLRFQYTDQLD